MISGLSGIGKAYVACLLATSLGLCGCGGGSGSASSSASSSSISSDSSSSSSSSTLSLQQRIDAATTTAQNHAACTAIQPFYWEIGDQSAVLVGGTASQSGATTPAAGTQMLIASASKWLFGAYVVQLRNGNLSADDIAALTMRTPYTNFSYSACIKLLRSNQDAETVHECFAAAKLSGGNNNDQNVDANQVGKFYYNGGHFQSLADGSLSLGGDNNVTLQGAIADQIGHDFTFTYDSPQLAAGVQTSGQDYGAFLRKILSGQLLMHDDLGTQAVCTNPTVCDQAVYTPIPTSEQWHYSLAHWVEDDPSVGDGAFSSPGAFGFYPWIDASKTYYGVLARYATVSYSGDDPVSVQSVYCGRTLRKAWLTGVAQ